MIVSLEFPRQLQHVPSLFLSDFLFVIEQEEERNCWEGADGGASKPERHQSESELAHDFLCDDAKLEELPDPKFRSLRHLRQVKRSSTKRSLLKLEWLESSTWFELIPHTFGRKSSDIGVCFAGPRGCGVSPARVACAHGKSGHMARSWALAHPVSVYSPEGD